MIIQEFCVFHEPTSVFSVFSVVYFLTYYSRVERH
jgi:hypothetical protein